MSTRFAGTLCFATCLSLSSAANADHGGDPVEFHELVILEELLPTPPNNVFARSYPTEVSPNHGKSLGFFGTFYNLSADQPLNVVLWLDWLDPRLPGGQQTTTPKVFDVLPGAVNEAHTSVVIPFTPERVSVHLQNNGPGLLAVIGSLNHLTVPIPEPSALSLSIMTAAAFLARRSARRLAHDSRANGATC